MVGSADISQRRPWIRFLAKYIDISLYSIMCGCLIGLLMLLKVFGNVESYLLKIPEYVIQIPMQFISIMVFDTLILFAFGTTLGKYILKIKVTDVKYNRPSFIQCLIRNVKLFIHGLGAGVPLFNLVTLGKSKNKLKREGTTLWDENAFIVHHERVGKIRVGIIAIILFIVICTNIYSFLAGTTNISV